MNSNRFMSITAVILGASGVVASFMPQELLRSLGSSSDGVLPLLVQLLGAVWIGFAMLNWMARGSLIGGIYNRPVAVGNLVHFTVGAIAMAKVAIHGTPFIAIAVAAVIASLCAAGFAVLVFGSAVKPAPAAE